MALILMRHGPTEWNEAPVELVRGTVDVPLLSKARDMIRHTAEQIKSRYPNVHYVASDSLGRSKETAEITAQVLGVPAIVDDNLMPWPIGQLAGQFKPEVIDTIRHYVEHPHEVPPGGKPYIEFYRNWAHKLNSGRQAYSNGRDCVWVIHSSQFHALPSIQAGGEPEYDGSFEPAPASMMVL